MPVKFMFDEVLCFKFFTCNAFLLLICFSDMAASPPNVGELVRGWSWIQKSTGGMAGNREVDKLAEVVKATTAMRARQLVAEANGKPPNKI